MSDDTPAAGVEDTPGEGRTPEPERIEPSAPEEFGLVQVWWGDGKGKTTATLGMGMRAAGHGFRVHMLQFMKGGASSVDAVRGEYNAIAALPGFSYENLGHYGWHGMPDGSDEEKHEAQAEAGLERARELLAGAAEATLDEPIALDGDPDDGVHMLVLDEVLYAAERGLIAEDDVLALIDDKPADLELVLSGSHTEPTYLEDRADLITNVRKQAHPIEDGQRARRGTEF
ncbi:cob(I)yrinic acid a,c-diamide adenosyltransferase [Halobiforma haloterrestris]|uniref:Cob(I)yrinic acid a,c-diamide adenosyltransferase n=1 Tax=Natronobacterium haloterrestre TaxID=148448 RepID=A0A1I1FG60_NATHA|nr:cob(I)yrinic acid a,c-diamide adenosyltransferase [Halobiforma haloterrestris]SFB98479.1 cob(I)yrinic acid a,c-diamide adenosyltransferase [Halobiforma haloterrestris]